jgi:hypothetical protein
VGVALSGGEVKDEGVEECVEPALTVFVSDNYVAVVMTAWVVRIVTVKMHRLSR